MKKFIITLLAVILAVTGTFTCLAASPSKDYSGLKDAIRKYRNVPDSYTDKDINIEFYKTLSNGTVLTKFDVKESTITCVVREYNLGNYEYICPSEEEYIYDGKKVYGLETAYKRKIIDNKTVKEIAKIFPDKFQKPKFLSKKVSLKAGTTKTLKVKNSTDIGYCKSSNKKVAAVDWGGEVTALKKGTAKITVRLGSGKKFTSKITVTSDPKLTKNSKKLVQ